MVHSHGFLTALIHGRILDGGLLIVGMGGSIVFGFGGWHGFVLVRGCGGGFGRGEGFTGGVFYDPSAAWGSVNGMVGMYLEDETKIYNLPEVYVGFKKNS